MPRKSHRQNRTLPAYCEHKPTGQAYVRLTVEGQRKTLYLGTYNSRESLEAYDRAVGEWLASKTTPKRNGVVTVREVAERFRSYVSGRALKVKTAVEILSETFGERPADEFGAMAFDRLKTEMVNRGWSRAYSNELITIVKRVFKWAMQRGYVRPDQFTLVDSVEPLTADEAPTKLVEPVDAATVDATLPELPSQVADMVRFIRATGCRPGEAQSMKVGDIDRETWILELKHHKTAHKGKSRFIFIPPEARELILPRLLAPADRYVFSADEHRGRPFERRALGRAIDRAVKRINRERRKNGEPLLEHWHPYQLRHARAIEVREKYSAEVAQVLLGHAKIDMTQHYARLTKDKAVEVAKLLG